MLPAVKATFGISDLQVAGVQGTRELVGGLISLPGGVITDYLRKYWGLVLAFCMFLFGIGWLVMAVSGWIPMYPLLLLGMALVGAAATIWHLPAMSALSHHFSHGHRGTALSFHGVGGQLGDVLAPVATGFLLGYLAWQEILTIYVVVPLLLTLLVYWAFKNIGNTEEARQGTAKNQMAATKALFKIPAIWFITIIGGLRGTSQVSVMTFFPIYATGTLGLGIEYVGILMGLLLAAGIISTPVMGWLSDKYGRKQILVPGILLLAVMSIALPFSGGNILILGAVLLLLGLFLFSDQPILTAAALDIVGEGVAATTMGVMGAARAGMVFIGILVAGWVSDSYGTTYTFYFVSAIFVVALILIILAPIKARNHNH
jgi:MFS family permease